MFVLISMVEVKFCLALRRNIFFGQLFCFVSVFAGFISVCSVSDVFVTFIVKVLLSSPYLRVGLSQDTAELDTRGQWLSFPHFLPSAC